MKYGKIRKGFYVLHKIKQSLNHDKNNGKIDFESRFNETFELK